jgi:CHAT domain-containing protein
MLDHDQLRTIAGNPALVDSQEELDQLMDHAESCRDCSDALNRSVAFFQTIAEPLMRTGPHLSPFAIAWLRLRRFRPGADRCQRLSEWHLTCCTECRARFERPPQRLFMPMWRLASAVVVLAVVGGLLFYRLSSPGGGGVRGPETLELIQPVDGAIVTLWQQFKWTDVRATKYLVEIQERTSKVKVIEKQLAQNFFVVNQPEADLLHNNAEYSWKVTAFLGSRVISATPRTFRFAAQSVTPAATEEIQKLRLQALRADPKELPKVIVSLKQQLVRYPSEAPAAQIRSSLGDALRRADSPKEAAQEYRAALQIWHKLGNPDVRDQQRTLANFAVALQRSGDLSGALSAYRSSHAALKELSGPGFQRMRSDCALNEATLERRLGNFRAAREHIEEALELDQKLFANGTEKGESRIAEDLNNLGNLVTEDLEDPQAGLEYLLQARDMHRKSEELNGKPDDTASDTEDSIGVAYELLGRDLDAIAQFQRSLIKANRGTADSTAIDQTLNSIAELLLRRGDLSRALTYLKQAQTLRAKASPDEWWRTEELLGKYYVAAKDYRMARKHLALSIDTIQQFVKTLPDEERSIYQAEHLRPFFHIARLMIADGDSVGAFICLEHARAWNFHATQNDWCESHVERKVPSLRLAPGHAALSYFVGDMNDPVLCFMIIGDQIRVHELKASREIEAEIKDYLGKLGSPYDITSRRRLAADLLPTDLLQGLSRREIQRVLITPEAALNRVSFESLLIADTYKSLIDHAAVEIVPSVLAWGSGPSQQYSQPKDVLIVTAANSAACPESVRLPWAEREAAAVASFASSSTKHLKGLAAKDSILGNEASQFRILHFAVHGQAAHSLEGSELMLDCSSNTVLAGDRIREARLSRQLVVLSSCESAVGRVQNGEGIGSLADVFLRSGASCVIAARSRISDKNAYALMNSFYGELARQQVIDIALQRAQQESGAKMPSREWGAFSAFGKCDQAVPVTPSFLKRLELRFEKSRKP